MFAAGGSCAVICAPAAAAGRTARPLSRRIVISGDVDLKARPFYSGQLPEGVAQSGTTSSRRSGLILSRLIAHNSTARVIGNSIAERFHFGHRVRREPTSVSIARMLHEGRRALGVRRTLCTAVTG